MRDLKAKDYAGDYSYFSTGANMDFLMLSSIVDCFLKEHQELNNKISPAHLGRHIVLTIVMGIIMLTCSCLAFLFHRLFILFAIVDLVCVLIFFGNYKKLNIKDSLKAEITAHPDDDMEYIMYSKADTMVNRSKALLPGLISLIVVLVVPAIIFFKPISIYEKNDTGYSLRYYSAAILMPEEVVVPDTYNGKPVTEIRGNVFQNLMFKHVQIPETVTEIRGYTFKGCLLLQSIDLPSGTTRIGEEAFQNCISLKTVKWSSVLNKIGKKAFSGCWSLKVNIDEIPSDCVVKDDAFDYSALH